MLLLDTLPLVDFFKGQSEDVKRLILDFEENKTELGISAVTLSELFYILADFRGTAFAQACIDNLKVQIEVIPVSTGIAEKAGEFKFRYAGKGKGGLPMADAIIAATAWFTNAQLLTSDPHFDKVKEIKIRKTP